MQNEPIRVLRVIARLNVGGPALHVSYLTRELDARGYETTLVAGQLAEGEGGMDYVADELGVSPLYLDGLQRDVSLAGDLGTVRRLASLIRERRPHIVHTHTAKAGTVGRLAALAAGGPAPPVLVHTFHGHVLRGQFPPAKERVFRTIERRLARRTDALVAVGPQVRDDLVALRVAPATSFAVVRLGIDLDRRVGRVDEGGGAARRELGVGPDVPVVGWFGRLTDVKQPDVLLAAFARLRELPGGSDAVLVLVGDGPLRAGLEQRAGKLGIAGATRFLGFRSEVGPFYAACDVVALSSMAEGTPVTLIEALAAGRPVVSTDVDGVRDVVRDDGILVPVGDADALAHGIAELLRDPERRRAIGRRSSNEVRARYAVSRLTDDVDRLYQALLPSRDRL